MSPFLYSWLLVSREYCWI